MEDKYLLVILLISLLFLVYDYVSKLPKSSETMENPVIGTPASPLIYKGRNSEFKGLPIAIFGVDENIVANAILKKYTGTEPLVTMNGKPYLVQDEDYRKYDITKPWIYSGPVEEYRGMRVAYSGALSGNEINHLPLVTFPKSSSWYGWLRVASGCDDTSVVDPTVNLENTIDPVSEEKELQTHLDDMSMNERLTKILHNDQTIGIDSSEFEKLNPIEKEAVQASMDYKNGIRSVDGFTSENIIKPLNGDTVVSAIPSAVPKIIPGMKLSELDSTIPMSCNKKKNVPSIFREHPFEQLFEGSSNVQQIQYEDVYVEEPSTTNTFQRIKPLGTNISRKFTLQS
jgi:hypothetical protein